MPPTSVAACGEGKTPESVSDVVRTAVSASRARNSRTSFCPMKKREPGDEAPESRATKESTTGAFASCATAKRADSAAAVAPSASVAFTRKKSDVPSGVAIGIADAKTGGASAPHPPAGLGTACDGRLATRSAGSFGLPGLSFRSSAVSVTDVPSGSATPRAVAASEEPA